MTMRVRGFAAAGAAMAAILLPASLAHAQAPAATITAEGNVITGGLRFNPSAVSVKVGDVVQWTNTDFIAPHTATEDHGLWTLTGSFGVPSVTPLGFGPGEVRSRHFEAGSWSYFCTVHPVEMHGTISVPVELRDEPLPLKKKKKKKRKHRSAVAAKKKKKKRGQFAVIAEWAPAVSDLGQVFDVQARRNDGDWQTLAEGIRQRRGIFPGGPAGTKWTYRTRLRALDDPSRASGWSPPASITVG
jgi:plastocyanin